MRLALPSLLLCAGLSLAAESLREVHGMTDAFAAPGVALAWGVVRGTDEAATFVVVRITTDRTRYPWFGVARSDPFTQARHQVLPATRSADVTEVRAPRAHYAEFPRTEVRFYESEAEARADRPALAVFFLGVPDTTPEFATEDKLQAYLRDRVARPLNPAE